MHPASGPGHSDAKGYAAGAVLQRKVVIIENGTYLEVFRFVHGTEFTTDAPGGQPMDNLFSIERRTVLHGKRLGNAVQILMLTCRRAILPDSSN